MESTHIKPLSAGEVLGGRFEVMCPLFEGGMGCVYEGKQLGLDRKVAIKTLQPFLRKDSDWLARFSREVQISQRLTHPNTVRVYDAGQSDDGVPYIVMELLEGRTIEHVIEKKGKLPLEVVKSIAAQVLGSLIEAHAAGIVHRDIKPGNLMLCKQVGQPNLVKVLDFGVAHLNEKEASFETQSGLVVGTPHYMSPEQARGEPVDERSDLYSLGIALFEMATGTPPYNEGSPMEIAMQHLLPEPIEVPPDLGNTVLGEIIVQATKKNQYQRFQTAEEMLEALTEPDTAHPLFPTDSEPPSEEENRRTLIELDEKPTRVDVPQRMSDGGSRRLRLVIAIVVLVAGLVLVWCLLPRDDFDPAVQLDALEEEYRQSPEQPDVEQPVSASVSMAMIRAHGLVQDAWVDAKNAPVIAVEGTVDPPDLGGEETSRHESRPRERVRSEELRVERALDELDEPHNGVERENGPEPELPEEDETDQPSGMPIHF